MTQSHFISLIQTIFEREGFKKNKISDTENHQNKVEK